MLYLLGTKKIDKVELVEIHAIGKLFIYLEVQSWNSIAREKMYKVSFGASIQNSAIYFDSCDDEKH